MLTVIARSLTLLVALAEPLQTHVETLSLLRGGADGKIFITIYSVGG